MTNECKYCKSLLHFDSGAIAAEILAMRSGNSVVLEYQSVQETFLRLGLDFGEVPGSYSWPRRGARSVMLGPNGTGGSICPRWNGRARGTGHTCGVSSADKSKITGKFRGWVVVN